MSCCGDKRSKIYNDPYSQTRSSGGGIEGRSAQGPAGSEFEYIGPTSLTVKGAITGNIYRFEQPGSVIEVDRRDASFVTGIPNLRRVRKG